MVILLHKVSAIGNIWQSSQELGKILKLLIARKRYWSSANYCLGLLCLKQSLTHLSASPCDMFCCSSNSIKGPTHLSLWPKRMWEAFSISIEPLDGITTVLRLNNQQLMSHLKSVGKILDNMDNRSWHSGLEWPLSAIHDMTWFQWLTIQEVSPDKRAAVTM